MENLTTTTEIVELIERTLVLNESTLLEISQHHGAAIVGIAGNENGTIIINEVELESMEEHLVNEVYIVIALTLMVFSSITCVCLCLLYHKYQQWHQHVLESRPPTSTVVPPLDTDSLPSYTIVTGLPSYEEALEQLRQLRLVRNSSFPVMKYAGAAPNDEIDSPGLVTFTRLSIGDLVKFHKQEKCKFLC
ncbi:hypothetical protein WDU94_008771 [Cyamophila willieti]